LKKQPQIFVGTHPPPPTKALRSYEMRDYCFPWKFCLTEIFHNAMDIITYSL
ncbi:hypothetical protein L9F63_017511, partial [Diploptera punctata]